MINNLMSFFWRYISFFWYFSIKSWIFCFTFTTISRLFCGELLDALVILSAILLPIKSLVTSAVFWIALFEALLSASIADYLA